MKLFLISQILGVGLCLFVNYSGAATGDEDIDSNLNGIGEGTFAGGPEEIMPDRDLTTQEVKNLIYITMNEYFEKEKKSSPNQPNAALSHLEDSVKHLLRPKRFVFGSLARNGNDNGGGGPIVNLWRGWSQRRRQRIQRRRQRWQDFRKRQQAFFQNMGMGAAQTSQRLQSMSMQMAQNLGGGGTRGVAEVTRAGPAGAGHRIVLSNKVPPTGVATGQSSASVTQTPLIKTT